MTIITGVVLAGGLSTRMGTDKSQLMRKQQTMLEFTAAQLKKAGVNQVVISGPPSLPTTEYPILPDQLPKLGPMGGISSIANQLNGKADYLLIIPVDLPLLDHRQLITLKEKGLARDQVMVFKGQPLPLFLPLKASYLQRLNRQVELAENLSIRHFLDNVDGEFLESDNQLSWFNSNTPADWQKALSLID